MHHHHHHRPALERCIQGLAQSRKPPTSSVTISNSNISFINFVDFISVIKKTVIILVGCKVLSLEPSSGSRCTNPSLLVLGTELSHWRWGSFFLFPSAPSQPRQKRCGLEGNENENSISAQFSGPLVGSCYFRPQTCDLVPKSETATTHNLPVLWLDRRPPFPFPPRAKRPASQTSQ